MAIAPEGLARNTDIPQVEAVPEDISTARQAAKVSPAASEDLDASYVMVPPSGQKAAQGGKGRGLDEADGINDVDDDDDGPELVDAMDALEVDAGGWLLFHRIVFGSYCILDMLRPSFKTHKHPCHMQFWLDSCQSDIPNGD
jgi:hypothetical protein